MFKGRKGKGCELLFRSGKSLSRDNSLAGLIPLDKVHPFRELRSLKGFTCELIYYEAYKSEIDGRNRERRLKHYAQALTALKTRLKESLK